MGNDTIKYNYALLRHDLISHRHTVCVCVYARVCVSVCMCMCVSKEWYNTLTRAILSITLYNIYEEFIISWLYSIYCIPMASLVLWIWRLISQALGNICTYVCMYYSGSMFVYLLILYVCRVYTLQVKNINKMDY